MKIIETKTIYRDEQYVSFPNLSRLSDGTILCAFRHALERQKEYGRCTHIDPTAKDVFILSPDEGATFTQTPQTIVDETNVSDQDPCVNVLSDGRIIVTYFNWELCPFGNGPEIWGQDQFDSYGRSLWDIYDCFTGGIKYSISDDNGKTWRHYPRIQAENVPACGGARGNILELPNGDLLLPFYGALNIGELSRSSLLISHDRGEHWEFYSTMAFDPECKKNFLEPNIYRTPSGKIVGLFRTQTDFRAPNVDFEETYLNLHIAVSEDDGKTFGPVREIEELWGSSPFHALRLADDRVLLAYGYRRKPFGIRARVCDPELEHIGEGEEIILRSDAPNGDLGYPHSILLKNGHALVSYYISAPDEIRTIDATEIEI